MIRPQLILDINDELIVDNFAGGGGASTGIELALGRHVDMAINHDPEAVAMHQVNHPQTVHHCESVWDVDPVKACAGRPVGLMWLSPDCKHFSKAKGGKPREKKIRGLALVGLRWVQVKRPRVLILENVEEFQTWGPLLPDGSLNPKCKGNTFRSYVGALRRRGYVVEWRELRACDYGAPTIRKRLFLIARCDGVAITWPAQTHGNPDSIEVKARKLKPWRTAADCIDWSLLCPSIFERKRPLADATCRRIAKGIMRYVVNCADPFIVNCANSKTTGRGPNVWTTEEPLRTVTAAPGFAVVAPVLTEHANQKHERVFDCREPLRTQCAEVKGGHFALVNAFLAKHYTGVVGSAMHAPIGTVTSTDHHSLVTASLVRTAHGDVDRKGKRRGRGAHAITESLPTVTASPDVALIAGHITKFRKDSVGSALAEPMHTITAGPKENPAGAPHALGLVEAFLIKYYGTDQDPKLNEPLHTATTKDRFGLVTVNGEKYSIADIGLRMLAPRELFKAQGFPDSYIIGDNPAQGLTLTKSAQVRMCGNSVCPPLAEALVRANVPEMSRWSKDERKAAVA